MTLKRLRHSDVADVLHLAKVKESELLSVLLSFFNRAKWLSQSVRRFHNEGTNSHVDVTFDAEGKIQEISSELKNEEITALSDSVSAALLENQKETVGQSLCFSRQYAVKSFYRYKDAFQVLPIPAEAPHAPQAFADHPFVLQFTYVSCRDISINARRRAENAVKLMRILGIPTRSAIFPGPRYTGFLWGSPLDKDSDFTSRWIQEGYGFSGFVPELPDFSSALGTPRMNLCPAAKYYGEHFFPAADELVFPDIIDEYLDKVFALNPEDSKNFAIASTWFSQIRTLWKESSSAAFIAAVSAIEAVLEKKAETCSSCGQPKFGVTKKFKTFIKQYVPDVQKRYSDELKLIYRVRSDLAHGSDLLLADLESWDFFFGAKQEWQSSLQRNTYQIIATALLYWVLSR
jgi:hypothetical protein